MNVPVVMPQLGLTMTEGSVAEWLKKPGESVSKGEMLFVVSTDKADMEVESLDEGKLVQIVVEPGKVVPVGTVIAYLGGSGDEVSSQPRTVQAAIAAPPLKSDKMSVTAAAVEHPAAASGPLAKSESLPASPRARKVARELGIDISQVSPRPGSGRIVEEDVRRFAETARPVVAMVAPPVAKATPPDARRRRLIAERLTKSIQTIPHFSVSVELRADQLISLRESLKGPVEKQMGLKLTVTDLLLKALGLALGETTGMRSVWNEGDCQAVEAIDLGLAIAAVSGVVAPVIRNVGALDLVEIARWRQAVTEKARGGRLSLTDLEGGIGTLSNLGMYRVDHFQAIISPGQSFIVAVGKIDHRPWVEAGALTVAPTMTLTLSVDHRVADGALAAQFLERITEIIENPYRLLWAPAKS
jgi:pyruvate dehydrogenase E2 component (dihydrolipoamide acetyltransferase)